MANVIERAVITARGDRPNLEIPGVAVGRRWAKPSLQLGAAPEARTRILTEAELNQLERDNTLAALERCGWKIYGAGGASELLRMRPTTLISRMKKMRVTRRDREPPA